MRPTSEMDAFDQLAYPLRRAIDESPWGCSALWVWWAVRKGLLTTEAATARIRGFRSRDDANGFYVWLQIKVRGYADSTL